jgi:hypothetical protein
LESPVTASTTFHCDFFVSAFVSSWIQWPGSIHVAPGAGFPLKSTFFALSSENSASNVSGFLPLEPVDTDGSVGSDTRAVETSAGALLQAAAASSAALASHG